MKKSVLYLITIFVSAHLFASCSSCQKEQKEKETMSSGLIYLGCDESFEPIINEAILVFEARYPEATIVPDYVTEERAFDLLVKDSARVIIATRPVTDYEKAQIEKNYLRVTTDTIAMDAIAVITHKSNPDTTLTVDELRKIVTGEVTRWEQLDPNTPLGNISFFFDQNRSSIVRYAIDSLTRGEPLYDKLYARRSNQDVIDYVAEHPNAMGVIGVDWVGSPVGATRAPFYEKVNVMAVGRDEKSAVQPAQKYMLNKSYPLLRTVFLHHTDPTNGVPTGFAIFLMGQRGQLLLSKSNLLPWYLEHGFIRDVRVVD